MTDKLQFHLDGFDRKSDRMVLQIFDENDILTSALIAEILGDEANGDPEITRGEYRLDATQATKLLGMFGHAPNMETTEYYVGRVSLRPSTNY